MKFLMPTLIVLTLWSLFPHSLFCAESESEKPVAEFIAIVRSSDRAALAKRVVYPLHRQVPLSTVKTPEEFLRHFDEMLDEPLLKAIAESKVSDDWTKVGWRGSMFASGTIWLDESGRISAINYQTSQGAKERARLIELDKSALHVSMRQLLEPILEWKTKDYRIRIDRMSDKRYRYAVWPVRRAMSEKPDLMLTGGEVRYEGSGGNHSYTFKNGAYVYRCDVNIVGPDDMAPGDLSVYNNNTLIMTQPVLEVIHGW